MCIFSSYLHGGQNSCFCVDVESSASRPVRPNGKFLILPPDHSTQSLAFYASAFQIILFLISGGLSPPIFFFSCNISHIFTLFFLHVFNHRSILLPESSDVCSSRVSLLAASATFWKPSSSPLTILSTWKSLLHPVLFMCLLIYFLVAPPTDGCSQARTEI